MIDQRFEVLMAENAGKLSRILQPRAKLKPERVQEELKTLAGWKLGPTGQELDYAREFVQPTSAAKFAAFVAELAAVERQPVQVAVTANWVLLTLHPRVGATGLTLPVIDFARQLG